MSNNMNWAEMDTEEVVRHITEACLELNNRGETEAACDAFCDADPGGGAPEPAGSPRRPALSERPGDPHDPDGWPSTRPRKIANEMVLLCNGQTSHGPSSSGSTASSPGGWSPISRTRWTRSTPWSATRSRRDAPGTAIMPIRSPTPIRCV